MDALFQAGLVFAYACIGLAVALWRLCRMVALSIGAGVVAWALDREQMRAGDYQPEEESDGQARH